MTDVAYDSAYQLTKETRTGGSAFTASFWYDSAGNRTKRLVGASTTAYAYDYIDRLTKDGGNTRGWDYWGNTTSVGSHAYSWDDTDRMTKFDKSGSSANDFTVGYLPGSWKRYKRIQDSTTEYFIYDGANVVASYAGNGTLNATYLTPGLDSNLSATRGGSTYYYMQDALGTVRNLVDTNETTQNTYDYRAFGKAITTSENVTNTYRFTGRERESGAISNLHYYRNRYYGPDTGQFLSRDAMWADPARGWGYVANVPVMMTDRFGLAPNQEGTTDPETIAKEIECLVKQGMSPEEALARLRDTHGGNENRYFYTDKYGWVDVRHFAEAARMARASGSVITKSLGFLNEVHQWLTEWGDDYRSGFSPEDMPSNSAGADFGDDYLSGDQVLSAAFAQWLLDVGGRTQDDPISHWGDLPATDPSVRGGKGRGSSNPSSDAPNDCSSDSDCSDHS